MENVTNKNVTELWHDAYDLSDYIKKNKGYYDVIERLCLCVRHDGETAIGWIEVDGDDVSCCSPHLISTLLLSCVVKYAYIDELLPLKFAEEITRNILNNKNY